MSEKMKNIPKLRFPEFMNSGEWKEKKLGSKDISYSISSGKDKNDLSGTFDLYGSTGIIGKSLSDSYIGNFILVARVGANAGFLTKVTGKFGVTDNTLVLNLHEQVNLDFVFSLLEKFGLNNLIFGSGQPLITGRQLKELSLFFPKLKEQEKIADCLSSIDSLISLQNQKVELLKEHKNGLLQNLFPREGKKVPKLRFNEFKNNGEWEEKILDEICDLQDGFAFSSSDFIEKKDNAIQVIRITDINNKNNNLNKVYVSNTLLKQNEFKKYLVKKGDLLLSLTGAAGFNFFIWNDVDALINQRTMKIVSKDDNNKAIELLIESLIHKKINIHGVGQNNNLSKDILKNVSFLAPKPKEQQKIANFLISVDELINVQSQKVEALKEHKKSLLEQLFSTQKN